jgi:hypothetical protein
MSPIRFFQVLAILIAVFALSSCEHKAKNKEPHLEMQGTAKQLFVAGRPFLVLGGELHNSSSSSREYMKEYWPILKASAMNTVLAAVDWSLVEPEEGKFNFKVVDGLIEDARAQKLHLILLWFGSWKNGQSHYIPDWMKSDFKRFPRVKGENGKSLEILSVFSKENQDADAKAFAAMMKHIKAADSDSSTVIMIQVENEVGILGSPRDHGDSANIAFNSQVPKELIDYLVSNKDKLLPETSELWSASGFKESGSWEDVFGTGDKCDEIFMAWYYARYLDYVTKSGKSAYDIPMFVNAWLVQQTDSVAGNYPSGGPQAHMLDIWRAGAPDIDLYCPDIYRPVFSELCALYTRNNNTLFIPESRAGEQGAGQFFYAIGKYKAIGYSPFGFESRTKDVENDPMTKAYKLASSMAPVILEAQKNGAITSVLLDREIDTSEEVTLGDYKFLVELLTNRHSPDVPSQGYAMIINIAPDEFIIYGNNIQISFSPATPGPAIAGIARDDEGIYSEGKWIPGRRLNGDDIMIDYDLAKKALENKTGTGIRFGRGNLKLQRVKLYRYE